MERFKWQAKYELGVPEIDDQHRQLLALANLVFEAMESGKAAAVIDRAIAALVLYTQTHFIDEEDLYGALNSSLADEHHRLHEELRQEILELQQAAQSDRSAEMGDRLSEWVEIRLLPHMMYEDRDAHAAAAGAE
ncbi:MAG: hemerythrin domain-containing protein [Alphaproteobacteria bacterium]|jgi:hemerythrin|nr:hypothetical protein [Rhodospirillaceae bacterium]MDP6406460.1 hemerythrin domain-containing protein [Alphaproteobacteria bacterium]|tara:strand:+ start:382 stop:786 length:405 start_codon:yes stop_codon:yes gene_type:complete